MKSAREMIEVMEAYERGEEIEIKISGVSWERCQSPIWTWGPCDYRIKPKAQYRPWKPEEVPVGAVIRYKGNSKSLRWLITCSGLSGFSYGSVGMMDSADALKIFEHSTDGCKTWSPCGVRL